VFQKRNPSHSPSRQPERRPDVDKDTVVNVLAFATAIISLMAAILGIISHFT
jgi:hypothetical protein